MKFQKYNSIENHYRTKFINKLLESHPSLKNEKYILTEKLDGSNCQLIFHPNQEMLIGKRNSLIPKDMNFFNIHETLKKYEDFLQIIQNHVDKTEKPLKLFGEIFGDGVQKRVYYGQNKHIRFFDCLVEEEPNNLKTLTPHEFLNLLNDLGSSEMHVPVIKIVNGLDNALNFDVEIPSYFNKIDDNIMEGIVIKPYDNNYYNYHMARFIIKKKSKKFQDKPDLPKSPKIYSDEINNLKELFLGYINENRLQDIFSKEGVINDMPEIGKYIGLLNKDAYNDFIKDHDLSKFDKKEVKVITNGGSKCLEILKKYL